jgi:GT2 family glycosyltransferase
MPDDSRSAAIPALTPIEPVRPDAARPLWSVMIPTYNCADYLRRTLESILAQDPGPDQMQIEVVDDCSTAAPPEEVVGELGKGRVLFHRNEQNLGVGNFNVCLARSRGHLVQVLHQDDYVGPQFYKTMAAAFEETPECAAIFSRCFLINSKDELLGVTKFCSSLATVSRDPGEFLMANPLRTPGVVVRRSFYERYGGFSTRLSNVEDWEMWVRAIVHGGARMLKEPLAYYRQHDQSTTNRNGRRAENLRDHLRLSAKWQADGLKGFDHVRFHRESVRLAFCQALEFAARGDREAALANFRFYRKNATPIEYPLALWHGALAPVHSAARRARERFRRRDRGPLASNFSRSDT